MSDPAPEKAALPCVFIHLHVPKCAGSSINFAMAEARRGRVLSGEPHRVIERLSARCPQENDALFDAIGGHFQWGMHSYFSRPCVYFSVVRDPVERICSFFNFVHATPGHPLHPVFKADLVDLDNVTKDFIRDTRGLWVSWSNYFCFAYSGSQRARRGERGAVEAHVAREIDRGAMLIGDLAAVTLLLGRNALLPPAGLPALNAGPETTPDFVPAGADTLSPRVRDLLRRINQHDLALLDHLEETGRLASATNFQTLPAARVHPGGLGQ